MRVSFDLKPFLKVPRNSSASVFVRSRPQSIKHLQALKPLRFKPSNRVKPSSRSQEFKTSQAPQLFQEFKLPEPTVQSFNFKSFPAETLTMGLAVK
jgi:hypothetical protein